MIQRTNMSCIFWESAISAYVRKEGAGKEKLEEVPVQYLVTEVLHLTFQTQMENAINLSSNCTQL